MTLKITTEYLDKALLAVVMHPDGKYSIADVFNKAQELVEQATQDQFITADEAQRMVRDGGEAEWLGRGTVWKKCHAEDNFFDAFSDGTPCKHRAARKEVTAEPLASLPEELLTPEVKKALGEWIDSEQEPHAELRALYAQQKYNTANGLPGGLGDFDWQTRAGTFMDWLTIEPDWSENLFYQCVPKPNCQVKNLDTGVTATMTREAAKLLQAETKDICDWCDPATNAPFDAVFVFNAEGVYTYRLRKMSKDDAISEIASLKARIQLVEESLNG